MAQVVFARRLTEAWLRRGLLAWALWPLSLLYGLLVRLRRTGYRRGWLASERVAVPVVVVGNVVAGGAGKTPVVMALVQHLQERGIRVGVVSRGYGRSGQDCREVLADSIPEEVGDEPALIRRRTQCPVFVAAQRSQAAHALLARHPATQLLICDDGLQHLQLQRDLEIGVFDDRGVGNGWLLPAGPLREPWPRRLDLVLHSGKQPAFAGFRARRELASHALRADGSRVPLASLRQAPVDPATGPASQPAPALLAVAAIARPEAFFSMLREQGLTLTRCLARPDHDDFDDWVCPDDQRYTVLCTEKDALKLWRKQADALAVPLDLAPEPAFFAAFDARIAPWLQPPKL